MQEQDWKNIVEELTEQIKIISLERAVSRADVRKAINLLEEKDERIAHLEEQVQINNAEAEIQTTKAK